MRTLDGIACADIFCVIGIDGYRFFVVFHFAYHQHIVLALDEQIYAQARYLVEMGFQYWFDLEDIETLEAHNDDFRAQENEEQLLAVYFDIPAEGCGQFMTTAEISDKLVIKGSIKKPMSLSKLGMLLQKAGYKGVRTGKMRTRGWLVYERPLEEVKANRNIEGKE